MGFNDPNKPKILRTHLTEETLRNFKSLAAKKDISMNDYLEKMIIREIKKGE
jgi:hypothetical protein